MKAIMLAAVVALVGTPALAGEWRMTGESTEYVQAVDVSTIRAVGRVKTIWSVTAYYKVEPEGHDFTMFHERIDCDAQTIQVLGYVDRKLADTDYGPTSERPEMPAAIVPESVGWAKYEAVCEAKWPNTVAKWESARLFANAVRALEEQSNEHDAPVPD